MAIIDMDKYIGMKLEDAMNEITWNCKVGAVDGSGFIFCGIPKGAEIDYEGIEESNKAFFDFKINKKEEYIMDAVSNSPTPGDYMYKFYESGSSRKMSAAGYFKAVERYFNKMNTILAEYRVLDNWRKTAPRLRDRKIVEVYASQDISEPEGTMIIRFEGYERGQYWTTNETVNGVVEIDEEDDE